jgi:ParB-like chromosome segregation protein Spo0J
MVSIDKLRIDPNNARDHGPEDLTAIKESLTRFGQRKPIVVGADGMVQAGNGTLLAARELGWTMIATVQSPLEGDEAAAYAIADNRTGELAKWHPTRLGEHLERLGERVQGLAFTPAEIEQHVSTARAAAERHRRALEEMRSDAPAVRPGQSRDGSQSPRRAPAPDVRRTCIVTYPAEHAAAVEAYMVRLQEEIRELHWQVRSGQTE